MPEFLRSRTVSLSAATPRIESPRLPLPILTDSIGITIRRPTTVAQAASWPASARVRVSLVVVLDGAEYRTVGHVSGGVRTGLDGVVRSFYSLFYRLPVLFGTKARAHLASSVPDAQGFHANVPLTRLGELRQSTYEGYVLLERLSGTCTLEVTMALTTESPAPVVRHKNSVAFDAATDAQEVSGDGVISLSHTSSGSDRAVFVGSGNSAGTPQLSSSCTYGGTSMTEMWNIGPATFCRGAGYRLHNQATGAQTVTATLAGATDEYIVAVASFTGVDQTTPVGTAVSATVGAAATSSSLTVSSVAADDMVVDFLYTSGGTTRIHTVGADQTERTNELVDPYARATISTQSGTAGGVMSWTYSAASAYGGTHGAVAFKTAPAATVVTQAMYPPRLAGMVGRVWV